MLSLAGPMSIGQDHPHPARLYTDTPETSLRNEHHRNSPILQNRNTHDVAFKACAPGLSVYFLSILNTTTALHSNHCYCFAAGQLFVSSFALLATPLYPYNHNACHKKEVDSQA